MHHHNPVLVSRERSVNQFARHNRMAFRQNKNDQTKLTALRFVDGSA